MSFYNKNRIVLLTFYRFKSELENSQSKYRRSLQRFLWWRVKI